MLIPIRCKSCNRVLSWYWFKYLELVRKYRTEKGQGDDIQYLKPGTTKTAEGLALDELKLALDCCRSRMLTHVDLL